MDSPVWSKVSERWLRGRALLHCALLLLFLLVPIASLCGVFGAENPSYLTTLQDPDPEVNAIFGCSLAVSDLNGDGNDDVIVGAYYSDVGGLSHAGETFIFLGPDFTYFNILRDPDPEAGAEFGDSLAVGDVNSDGNDDVIVSAPSSWVGGLFRAGEAFIFLGPSFTQVIPLQDPDPEREAIFGCW